MPPKQQDDLKALTSLRFFAAVMIVLLHAKLYFPWRWLGYEPMTMVHGVSFFFVLSGFILTHVYTSKPFPGYRGFLLARFARLWPVHIFSLIVLVMFVRADSIQFDGVGMFNKWIILAFNVSLVHSIIPYFSYIFSWNSVSWSISTEFFFYLAFPVLLVNIERTWHWKLAASAILAGAVLIISNHQGWPIDGGVDDLTITSLTYSNPLVRGFEFCLGMSSWVIWNRYVRKLNLTDFAWTWVEFAALFVAIAWLTFAFHAVFSVVQAPYFRLIFGASGSCWIFACLIVVLASSRGAIGRLLSKRPFVFLGEISFSMYMLHQIFMKICFTRFPQNSVHTVPFFVALLVGSALSFVFIENPCRRFIGNRISHKQTEGRSPVPGSETAST